MVDKVLRRGDPSSSVKGISPFVGSIYLSIHCLSGIRDVG
jgi:hypothetical protein